MTDKHTPGPWVFEPQGCFGTKHKSPGTRWVNFPLGYISKAPHSQPFLELEPGWKEAGFALVPAFQKLPIEELDANARLIAAAPDLLEALKAVQQQCFFDDDDGAIGVSEDVVIPSDLFNRICAAIAKAEGRS